MKLFLKEKLQIVFLAAGLMTQVTESADAQYKESTIFRRMGNTDGK